jgi:hypothetical protein
LGIRGKGFSVDASHYGWNSVPKRDAKYSSGFPESSYIKSIHSVILRERLEIAILDEPMTYCGLSLQEIIQSKFGMTLEKWFNNVFILFAENGAGAVDHDATFLQILGEITENGGLNHTQPANVLFAFSPLQVRISPKRPEA